MTQEIYQKAMKFAGEKHSDQKVPGSNSNYLLHLANVAMEVLMAYQFENNFDLNYAIQVAILHDTIEDTTADFEEVKSEFGEKIAEAVQALTKNEKLTSKEDRMKDSLERINKLQKEVGLVKLADRITNLQKPPKHWTKDKIQKYQEEARFILERLKGKNDYLHDRLGRKIKEYESNLEGR